MQTTKSFHLIECVGLARQTQNCSVDILKMFNSLLIWVCTVNIVGLLDDES